ncbi:hypothetical protein [Streptomyces goshikiensis]|uniref:hypothetical protein n=1 Tax=Streptomyces goshikiensis TaxID=1942 RepID=UPI0033329B92
MADVYEYVPHHLLRRPVRDVASGMTGVLMAVVRENVSDNAVYQHWVELAYIRGTNGIEWSTAAGNIEPADG